MRNTRASTAACFLVILAGLYSTTGCNSTPQPVYLAIPETTRAQDDAIHFRAMQVEQEKHADEMTRLNREYHEVGMESDRIGLYEANQNLAAANAAIKCLNTTGHGLVAQNGKWVCNAAPVDRNDQTVQERNEECKSIHNAPTCLTPWVALNPQPDWSILASSK
jgi:hypothetical protein